MTEAGDYYGSLGALLPDIWWEPGSWDDEPVADGAGTDEAVESSNDKSVENAAPEVDADSGEAAESEDQPIPPDESLLMFMDWAAEQGTELWPHQEEALLDLAAGDNVILGTPTGSGKSMVALGMHFMSMCEGKRCFYTAPIKALVNEKFFDLVDVLGRENVGMITGDTSINPDAPLICCTAEILANEALREGEDAEVCAVAMDEFHYYGDPDRGWAWQVPLLTLPHTQFLLMSATLGDMTEVAEVLKEHTGRTVDVIDDAPRPVPLIYRYVETPLENTVELSMRNGETPVYVVHSSQQAALTTAQSLANYGITTKEQRKEIKAAVGTGRFTTAFGKTLQRLLECGVGVHHAGMLPRYRRLVEQLAQQGLLPVICGTDTLGVGINVPIHTVLLVALTKYDGTRVRRLRAREFHQTAGRAGRYGFDDEGVVIAEAPEHEIENAKALIKAGDDPKKRRAVKRKQPPEGFVGWNEQTFQKLVESPPETLKPHLRITHSMVLAECMQGGDAWTRVNALIDDSNQTDEQKAQLKVRASEIFTTLLDAGVVVRESGEGGGDVYSLTIDLPENFALDQPLSPFLFAALELLDPEDEDYALDVVSMVEATLENPWQVLRMQERRARDRAIAEMKAEGIEYDERMERLQEVTYPKPLEELLDAAFERYCEDVPWARDFELQPKSVLREMLESAADFKSYVAGYGLARSEGTLLRYLSDAYRTLARTVPPDKRDERLSDIISWLGVVVRTTDSSLVDEWESAGELGEEMAFTERDAVVRDRRGLTVLVRNALFRRVRLAAHGDVAALGELDAEWSYNEAHWRRVLEEYHEVHEEIIVDADARSWSYLFIDENDELSKHVWRVHQIFSDENGDKDFGILGDVDLDATQDGGEVVFSDYRVGFIEDLLDSDK